MSKVPTKVISLIVAAVILCLSNIAYARQANENSAEQQEPASSFWSELVASSQQFKQAKCQPKGMFFRCLSGFEPSYFGYVGRDENHLDGSHLEFKVSIKYPLWGSLVNLGNEQQADFRSQAFYFSYTGQYDFYFGSRYSAPVISRRQNPGIFYKYEFDSRQSGYKSFSFGYFHESNGQEIDNKEMYDHKVIELLDKICRDGQGTQCLADPRRQQEAQAMATDYLSRGWDYLAASAKYTMFHRRDLMGRRIAVQTDFYLSARAYFNWQGLGFVEGREEHIDWLSGIDNPSDRVYDYNSVSLTINRTLDTRGCEGIVNHDCNSNQANWLDYLADNTDWSLTLQTGNQFNHLSYRLEFVHHIAGQFPLKLMYFNGYGENISTYQNKSSYWMLGIDLW